MTREETIKQIFEQKDIIIAQKKSAIKHADCVLNVSLDSAINVNKDVSDLQNEDINSLIAKLVINTTNIIDSHNDCHIPGLWTKSLQELGLLYLLKEHNMKFDDIISDSQNDGLKAYTKTLSWQALGQNYLGNTQALIFEGEIKKDRNDSMFHHYRKGHVLNHSVGMNYVKLFLCVDSDDPAYSSEKANWDKYYPQVANKEVADEKGYFWAVTEAKIVEGSAVVKGSNPATPILEIEPSDDTQKNEPLQDTQKHTIDIYSFN